MKGFKYDVYDEGRRLHGHGITYGYGDAAKPHVVKVGERHLVGRIASRSDWGSRSYTATNPAEWFLWEINWLKEGAQKKGMRLPEYSYKQEGESHMPRFTCTCSFEGYTRTAEGKNKQKAKRMAAMAVLKAIYKVVEDGERTDVPA